MLQHSFYDGVCTFAVVIYFSSFDITSDAIVFLLLQNFLFQLHPLILPVTLCLHQKNYYKV